MAHFSRHRVHQHSTSASNNRRKWVHIERISYKQETLRCKAQHANPPPALYTILSGPTGGPLLPANIPGRGYWLLFFLCLVTDISTTVAPIGVKFCMMAHIGPWHWTDRPFWGRYTRDPQIRNFGPKFWPFEREYLENGKSQRYMSIRA